ncbi:MAG: aminopeptidase P family protein [Archaeoglobus sp.]|nr:aminopeptidase P family protein [Archaeoglobus sp.]
MGELDPYVVYNEVYPQYDGRCFGRQIVDFRERINMDRMRKERLERLRSKMKEYGVEVMLNLLPHNTRYATGHKCMAYTSGLTYSVVPREDIQPVVFGHGTPTIHDRRHMKWLDPKNLRYAIPSCVGGMALGLVVHPEAHAVQLRKFGEQIKETLKEMGLEKETLVLDSQDPHAISALEKVGIKTDVKPEVWIKAQEIKTRDEIECLRMAAAIGDVCHYVLANNIKPGRTEYELAGLMRYTAMKMGAETTGESFVASGENTWPNYRNMTDRFIRPGDLIFADNIQISWNGYLTCYYRTFYCSAGRPMREEYKDAYQRAYDRLYAALKKCKPGNTTKDMAEAWLDEREYWGVEPDWAWGDNLMHGLGLVNYGPPQGNTIWSIEHPYRLEPGHVFAIETQEGCKYGQGVRIEKMIVVTETGWEDLDKFPDDHIIECCPLKF